jgi:hypothetical protein
MPTTLIANKGLSIEAGLNQIALLSAGGFVVSMALIFAGGIRILYPWF